MKPILFTTEMVQANLDGRKTQTRRTSGLSVINENPDQWGFVNFKLVAGHTIATFTNNMQKKQIVCPYGIIGTTLYVRENFTTIETPAGLMYFYQASHPKDNDKAVKWKPGIHLPKDFSRLFLTVNNIRVERLQDITPEDAIKEGIEPFSDGWIDYLNPNLYVQEAYPEVSFKTLFIKVHGGPIAGNEVWEKNPWVWVVDYRYNLKMILEKARR